MAKSKKKYYVVWEGHNTGVYETWAECLAQVKGYPNAKYKAYTNKEEAYEAVSHFPGWEKKASKKRSAPSPEVLAKIDQEALSVDAACSGNPGVMEYRGVWVKDGVEAFREGPFKQGTNNIGEFLAIVQGLSYLNKHKMPHVRIYTDSRTAIKWVKIKRANTKLTLNASNARLFKYIKGAENWLRTNTFQNPIEKWDTENWGEIPADFGRK